MKDVFDYLEEEDLLRNLPEALPQMEDETAAKRIEKMALEKLQAEAKLTLVSATSIVEGGAHDVVLKDNSVATVRR